MLAVVILITVAMLPLVLEITFRALRRRVRRRRWIGVPETALDEPIRAVKRARLRVAPDGRAATLAGLTLGGRYLVEDDARCPRRCTRPGEGCDCGFHALHPDAEDQVFGGSERLLLATSVRLDVELSGEVLEYELGFRAQHQRVLRVEVPKACASCMRFDDHREAVTLVAVPVSFLALAGPTVAPSSANGREPWAVLEPACELHRRSRSGAPTVELADVAGLLGTEVVWGPSHPADRRTADR